MATQEIDFSVDMKGSLSYKFLPLADKFLEFHKECHTTCTIWPLPPAQYDITLSSSGNIDTYSSIQLLVWSWYTLRYEILSGLTINQINDELKIDDLTLPLWYTPLVYIGDKILVLKEGENEKSLWLYISGSYRPMRQISNDIKNVSLDDSGEFIILDSTISTVAISKDFKNEVEIPQSLGIPILVSFFNDKWKISTPLWVFQEVDLQWEKNMRFTDFIDISPYIRIWYIAADDKERLSLSNLPLGEWVFVSLDRKTWKNYILKNGVTIKGFAYFGKSPGYIGVDGRKYTIEYNK
jgi:hypothetical protein